LQRKKLTFAGVPFVVKALAFAGVPFVVKALAFAASRSTDNVEVRSSDKRICLMLEKLLAGESLSTGGAGDESRGLGALKRGDIPGTG